jgi:hypothetical protein
MFQQTINGLVVKIITDPVGSNILGGVGRWSVLEIWQQVAQTGI